MTQAQISLKTKQAMVTSLKKFILQKPLSKITVSEICKDCGINRKTFYYHFEDIYDLLRWMLEQESLEVVKKFDLMTDYLDALQFIIDYADANTHILSCVYDAMGREGIKKLFLSNFDVSIYELIERLEKEMNTSIEPGYKRFLCDFYANALSGILIDWLHDRTLCTRDELVGYIALAVKTSLRSAILSASVP